MSKTTRIVEQLKDRDPRGERARLAAWERSHRTPPCERLGIPEHLRDRPQPKIVFDRPDRNGAGIAYLDIGRWRRIDYRTDEAESAWLDLSTAGVS